MKAVQLIQWPFIRLFLKVVLNHKVIGTDNLKDLKGKPIIFFSFHRHWSDSVILGYSLPFYFAGIRFIANKKYFNFFKDNPAGIFSPLVAFYVRLNKCFSVFPDKNKTMEEKLKEPLAYLKKNGYVFIYPEGKISRDGKIYSFKKGIGCLYKNSNAFLVPIISYWDIYKLNKLKNIMKLILRKEELIILIGKPLNIDRNLTYEEITHQIEKEALKLFDLKNFVQNPKIKFEQHNFLNKLLRIFLIPLVNNLPSKLIQKLLLLTQSGRIILNKPASGFAMEVLYSFPKENLFENGLIDGLLTFFLHKNLSQPKAIRNRLKLVKYLIKDKILQDYHWGKKNIKILSVAGGSGREIREVLKEINFKDLKIYYENIDTDKEILDLVKSKIEQENLKNVKFKPVIKDAKSLENLQLIGNYDIIEIIGLIDYLNDEEAINLLKQISNFLNEKGLLIWANIDYNNERKFVTKIGWPKMYYRNILDLFYLINNSGLFDKFKINIYQEPLRVHHLIVCYQQ